MKLGGYLKDNPSDDDWLNVYFSPKENFKKYEYNIIMLSRKTYILPSFLSELAAPERFL